VLRKGNFILQTFSCSGFQEFRVPTQTRPWQKVEDRRGWAGGRWKELTLQGTEASDLLGHQQPQLVATVGLPDLLAAVLGLSAGQGGDGLFARDVTLGWLVVLGLRGAATTFPGVGLSGDIFPSAAVGYGSLTGRQHLTGAFPQY
jgi:hypothetical protein